MRVGIIIAVLVLIFFIGGNQAQQQADSVSSTDINIVPPAVPQIPTRIRPPDLQNTQPETDGELVTPVPTLIVPSPQSGEEATSPNITQEEIQPDLPPDVASSEASGRLIQCPQPGCVVWSRPFTVNRSMNRWQVWKSEIGPGVMPWLQFAREAMSANPILKQDGDMFKAGKQYLLPVCQNMEGH